MQANTSRWYSQGFHFEPRARGEVIIFGFYVKAQQNVNQTEKKTRNNKHQICFRDDVKSLFGQSAGLSVPRSPVRSRQKLQNWHLICTFAHMELPAKLLDYVLQSNKSNINQQVRSLIFYCNHYCNGSPILVQQNKATQRAPFIFPKAHSGKESTLPMTEYCISYNVGNVWLFCEYDCY